MTVRLQPLYLPSQLIPKAISSNLVSERHKSLLLEAAYNGKVPLLDRSLHYTLDKDGVRQLVAVPSDSE